MLLNKVKVALRVTNVAFDDEIQDIIASCILDLSTTGVKKLDEADALIIRAVVTYAKAHFGLDNKDADRYLKSYEMIKTHLSLSNDYIEVI